MLQQRNLPFLVDIRTKLQESHHLFLVENKTLLQKWNLPFRVEVKTLLKVNTRLFLVGEATEL